MRSGPPQAMAGFTMMELLVTMVLLTIMLTGLAAMQAGSIRRVSESRRGAEALRLAELVISRFDERAMPTIPTETPVNWVTAKMAGDTSDMVNVASNGEDEGPYTVEYFVEIPTDSGTGLSLADRRLVSVRVCWLPSNATKEQLAEIASAANPREAMCNQRRVVLSMQRGG